MQDLGVSCLHPLVSAWFSARYGEPTAVQAEVWPRLARGEDVLALAPTGSGKTLAAFLVALSRLLDGTYPAGTLSVLYISPLKALNEDIRRNLLDPLGELRNVFTGAGKIFPEVTVETRSGDTSQKERRHFLSHPPSILSVTPESLAILLLNPKARVILASVRYVVLDEVHAVLGSKRGAFLSCQLSRLSLISGNFQRVALSATVEPPEAAAFFAGGLMKMGEGESGHWERRPLSIVSPRQEKKIELSVEFPQAGVELTPLTGKPSNKEENAQSSARYSALVHALVDRITQNRTTLVFTDSRRRCERLAFFINEKMGRMTAFAHHGSLSKEVRRAVETRLADGSLPCVVATGSLELGIDIGSIDEVVLAGCPSASSTALQRIGRAGHSVGEISRSRLYPFHGMELLESAALALAVSSREIEEVKPIANPLDILAQVLLSLCCEKERVPDELYDTILGFGPFETLPRSSFDRVVQMLRGRSGENRVRELKPRLLFDEVTGRLRATDGVLLLLYSSGGAITGRGSYSLRLSGGAKIGELDEEFVWERRTGDAFSFGTRSWRIVSIGSEAVEVAPLERSADFVPFWRAEERFRSPVLVRKTLFLLDLFSSLSDISPLLLSSGFSPDASSGLVNFLEAQRRTQGTVPLPGASSLVLELVSDPASRGELVTLVLHTQRGGAVNYPLSLSLSSELEELLEVRIEAVSDDNGILFLFPRLEGFNPSALLQKALLSLGDREKRWKRLRERLESSGLFGAAFREAAERSLLLPRAGFGKRTPLWITRQKAKRLFDAVSAFCDFPMTAEAYRSVLEDSLDIPAFDELCSSLARGAVRVDFFETRIPSPFARGAVWKETNQFLYEGDDRKDRKTSSTADSVIEEALGSTGKRPVLKLPLVADFTARLRRELPGWAPEDTLSLAEWVRERIAIPQGEWETLLSVSPSELSSAVEADPSLGGRVSLVSLPGSSLSSVVHRERLEAWESESLSFLPEWLRREGPVSPSCIASVFAVSEDEACEAVEDLVRDGILVEQVAVGDERDYICDRENLELLLRLSRKAARPEICERPLSLLSTFLARRQGLVGGTGEPWVPLSLVCLPARLWETEVFPARLCSYRSALLDAEISAGRLLWFGAGTERLGFCNPEDLDLALPLRAGGREAFSSSPSARGFWEIRDALGCTNAEAVEAIWGETWKGRLSSDSFEPVRRGLIEGFLPREELEVLPPPPVQPFGRPRQVPRALKEKWRSGSPVSGLWYSLASPGEDVPDPLDEEELDRDRVRLLVNRWGVLCRSLLERELPSLSWSRLLPAIRRLELSGELVAGRFFEGLQGLQFAEPSIGEELLASEAETGRWWLNALDPASLSGLDLDGRDQRLPARLAANRLSFRGSALEAVSLRNGKDVSVFIGPDDDGAEESLRFLTVSRRRSVFPEGKVVVERINGESAGSSPWAPVLVSLGFERDREKMVLW